MISNTSTRGRTQSPRSQIITDKIERRIRIGFQNIQGLSNKLPELLQFIESKQIDIMCIAETWLTPGATNPIAKECILDLRNPIRLSGRQGHGGLIVIVRDPQLRRSVKIAQIGQKNFCATAGSFIISDVAISLCYLSPQSENADIMEDLIDSLDSQHPKQVLVGDFNASRVDWGSTRNNLRGNLMKLALEDSNWHYVEPILGSHTTENNRPDHVLRQSILVENLSIIEDWHTRSDHCPLLFDINVQETEEMKRPLEKTFSRINIRKILIDENKEAYVSLLNSSKNSVIEDIEMARSNLISDPSIENKQLQLDKCYRSFIDWIDSSARATLGTFTFSNSAHWTSLLNQEIISLQQDLSSALIAVKVSQGEVKKAARRNVKFIRAKLANLEKEERAKKFRKFADDIEKKGQQSLIKIMSCMRSRSTKSSCQLDCARVNDYVSHFESTFGGNPTGTEQVDQVLLNNTNPMIPGFTDSTLPWTPVLVAAITKRMPSGKAGGTDEIMAELIKARQLIVDENGNETVLDPVSLVLAPLFQLIDEIKLVPTLWRQAAVCPIYKCKGSALDIKNYRPVSLTSVVRRSFEVGILQKILPQIENFLEPEQGGFRSKQSTLFQILALHEAIVSNVGGIFGFLDIQAAFDTVNRAYLWKILKDDFGIDANTIMLLRSLFDFNKAHLRVQGKKSEEFDIKRGVLQGSSLSPILFNCFINGLIKKLKNGPKTIKTGSRKWNSLFFADDAVLLADSQSALQILLDIAASWSEKMGIKFAPSKCEILSKAACSVKLNNVTLARVDQYKYLGAEFTINGLDLKKCIDKRLPKAKSAFGFLVSKGLNGYGWAPALCLALYKTFIRPTVDYGLCLAPLDADDKRRLDLFERNCFRKIFSVARNTSNGAIQGVLGVERLNTRLERLRASFFLRIHEESRSRIPAVAIYRDKLTTSGAVSRLSSNPNASSLCCSVQSSSPFSQLRRTHAIDRLTKTPTQLKQLQAQNKKYNNDILKLFSITKFQEDLARGSNVGLVHAAFYRLGKLDPLLDLKYGLQQQERRTLIMWLVGRVCYHQQCSNCDGAELSRIHGISCAGATETIIADSANVIQSFTEFEQSGPDLNEIDIGPQELNELDFYIMKVRKCILSTPVNERDESFHGKVKTLLLIAVKAIKKICLFCRENVASDRDDWGRAVTSVDPG